MVVPMFESMAQFILGDHMAGLSFDPPLGAGLCAAVDAAQEPYATRMATSAC